MVSKVASKMAVNFKLVAKTFLKLISSSFHLLSLAIGIHVTWKTAPHEILLWFPVHKTILVQKLHDATLASLCVLDKS